MNFKLVLITAFCVTLWCAAQAGAVNGPMAKTVALNFYRSNAGVNSDELKASLVYTKTEDDGTVDFYVFNISPVTGFVIVSGNDIFEPVIGYSTESIFHPEIIEKSGLGDWINTASVKMNYALRNQVEATGPISGLWQSYKSGVTPIAARAATVAPLLTTTWNQGQYYNDLCPYNTADAQRCVTGCVATAMSQIMRYWKWPTTGTGSYSYTDAPPTYSNNYGVQSANFGATTYNWSNMPNSLSSANSDVAKINYHCGVAVSMDYGDNNQGGSGAYVLTAESGGKHCAQMAYGTYFGYNTSTLQGVKQANYTSANWIALIQNELNAGRPVQYEGYDPTAGGHTWVCDGYQSNSLFHMNWGWGGYTNGYFSLSSLTGGGFTFNTGDAALIGIQPLTSTCGVASGLTASSITSTGATVSWVAVGGATSYKLQYKLSSATNWSTTTVTGTSATLNGLSSGSTYSFRVQTVCSSGSSDYSAQSNFTTSAPAGCGTPTGLAANSITTNGATISWAAISGVTGYNFQYKSTSATSWSTVSVQNTTIHITGLTAATSYNYRVQAVCGAGTGTYTLAATFTTNAAISCGTPSTVTAGSITSNGAVINWSAVTGAISYNLQYKLSTASSWTSVSTAATSVTLTGLMPSSMYSYLVQSVCAEASSAYSTVGAITTSAPPTCGTAKGLAAANITPTTATLTWAAISGATSYNLQWKAASATTWSTLKELRTASASLSNLSNCTAYQFQVQTVCSAGTSSYCSPASFTTTGCPVTYCPAKANSATFEYIDKVAIGGINNASGTNGGYGNFTNLSTDLAGNTAYTITLTPGYVKTAYTEYFTVYIDYNHNGAFTDAGETVLQVNGKSAVSGLFSVPATALNGATRMRVEMQYGAYQTNACATYSFGEVEDYTVNITGNAHITGDDETAPEQPATIADLSIYPNPAQNYVIVQYAAATNSHAYINIYDLQGQRLDMEEISSTEGNNLHHLNTSGLVNGIYIFEIESNNEIKRQRVIIAR